MVEDEDSVAAFKDFQPSAAPASSTPEAAAPPPPAADTKPLPTPPTPVAPVPTPPPPASTPIAPAPVLPSGGRIIASPLAKRLAAEQGINLAVSTWFCAFNLSCLLVT